MILITGATGLVGSHVLVQLSNKSKNIRALKRQTSDLSLVRKNFYRYADQPDEQWEAIEWVDCDLSEIGSLEEAFDGILEVYHCAAIVSFNPNEKQKMMRTNIGGTANMINAALRKKNIAFCYVSSIAAIGRDENKTIITEDQSWKKNKKQSAYSLSKYRAEQEVWRGIAEGLNAVIVNPSVILGPGNWHSGSSELFTLVWKGLPFYTEGVTGYVDVRDVASAMILLMEKQQFGQRFILSSENISYRQLFGFMAENFNRKAPYFNIRHWMGEIAWRWYWLGGKLSGKNPAVTRETARSANNIRYYSSEKIVKLCGFNFIPIRESIQQICSYFIEDQLNG